MAVFERRQLVPYSAEQMFALVDDVASYDVFLPWCRLSEVISVEGDVMRARVGVCKGPLKLTWITRNQRVAGRTIRMDLEQGPFQVLQGEWRFEPLDEMASHVSLRLEYELEGSLKRVALSLIFDQIVRSLIRAFIDRAGEIYGR